MVDRSPASRFGIAGWENDHLGRLHEQQDTRDSTTVVVGDDMRVRSERKFRGMRWVGQHLLDIQHFRTGWADTDTSRERAVWAFGVSVLLSFPQR